MANLFIDVHPSKAKLTLFLDMNCFLIVSTVSENSLRQMLLSMLADGSTNTLHDELYDRCNSRFDIAFHGLWGETNPKKRYQFQVSWWNLAVSKSFAASLERSVSPFSQYKFNLYVKYEFPMRTYDWNSSTSLSLQYGQSCVIDSRTSQFGNFWLCQFV